MTYESHSTIGRGIGPLRPREGLWTPKTTVSNTNAVVLVTGLAGKRICVTEVCYSNGAAVNIGMSLRFGADATGSDYLYYFVPSDGGGVAINLTGSELFTGIAHNLYAKTDVAGATYFNVGYFFV